MILWNPSFRSTNSLSFFLARKTLLKPKEPFEEGVLAHPTFLDHHHQFFFQVCVPFFKCFNVHKKVIENQVRVFVGR